uniref:Protein FAM92B n=2 Tax=Mesocestoides corti TaxID=53468 RepID=A0A5K3F1D3_MESCO
MQQESLRNSLHRTTEIKETEAQSKFFNERVTQIETYFGDLCAEFINYTRRTAKLRNNGDELSKILLNYSINEKINRTSARTLRRFAELLSTIEDYRHAEVDRLFAKVITPLSTYGEEVKRVRTNIRVETAARKKEVSQLKRLGREPLRGAEERLNIATRCATRSADALERQVIQFEAKKLKGLKDILTDFVHIEMLWHAKALETLTEAFNVVQSMQEEVDLADFRNTLFRSGTLASLDGDHFQSPQIAYDVAKSNSVPALNSSSPKSRGRQTQPAADTRRRENLGRENYFPSRGAVRLKNGAKFDGDDGDYEDDEDEEEDEGDDDDDDECDGNYDDADENVYDYDEEEEEEDDNDDEGVQDEEEEEDATAEEGSEIQTTPRRPSRKPVATATPLKSALKQPSVHTR